MIHQMIVPIIREKVNTNRERDMRTVELTYRLGVMSYGLVGTLGGIALSGVNSPPSSPNTFMDYFDTNLSFIVNLLLLFKLTTILPLIFFHSLSLLS
jgi:hypothetical protein